MKKLFLILFFFTITCCYGQTIFKIIHPHFQIINTGGTINYRGIAGYGSDPATDITNFGHIGEAGGMKSFNLVIQWSDIETSDGVFNFTLLDAKINLIKSYNIQVGVEVHVSPVPAYPNYLIALCGTYTTTNNTYLRYYNPVYITKYYRMLSTVGAHLTALGGIAYWQVPEGVSGDAGPDHGTLTSGIGDPYVPQNGDDDGWEAFRHAAWNIAQQALNTSGNTTTFLMFNEGDGLNNHDYMLGTFPLIMSKYGLISHLYSAPGHQIYKEIPYMTQRGEVQGPILTQSHGNKNSMELAIMAVANNLSIINITSGWFTQMLSGNYSETRALEFFNRYANQINAYSSKNAFIHLGSFVGIDDVVRWTEGAYGVLIDPAKQTEYNAVIAAIDAHAGLPPPGWGDSYKKFLKMQTTYKETNPVFYYVNNTRVSNLINNNGVGAIYNWDDFENNQYTNDFVFKATDNWSKFITQNNSLTTATLGYRGGSDTTVWGRVYKTIKTGQDLSFDINNTWNGGTGTANINFSIVYLDNNTATWSVLADVGSSMTTVATNTNINDGKWKVKTFSVNNMKYFMSEDFRIHTVSGGNTSFTLIEIGVL